MAHAIVTSKKPLVAKEEVVSTLRSLSCFMMFSFVTFPAFGEAVTYACAGTVEVGCEVSDAGTQFASASYSNPLGGWADANASASGTQAGGLVLKAYASAMGGPPYIDHRAGASAEWFDDITVSGTLFDTMDIVFSVTGSVSGDTQVTLDSSSACWMGYSGWDCAPATFRNHGSEMVLHLPSVLDLPGEPDYSLYVVLDVGATGYGDGIVGPMSSTADYAHSLILSAITPLDGNGAFVPGVSITATSGFDYNPYIGASAVPAPGAFGLMMSAFAALRLVVRRQRAV